MKKSEGGYHPRDEWRDRVATALDSPLIVLRREAGTWHLKRGDEVLAKFDDATAPGLADALLTHLDEYYVTLTLAADALGFDKGRLAGGLKGNRTRVHDSQMAEITKKALERMAAGKSPYDHVDEWIAKFRVSRSTVYRAIQRALAVK